MSALFLFEGRVAQILDARSTKFCTVTPKVCLSSVRSFVHVTILVLINLKLFLDFWKPRGLVAEMKGRCDDGGGKIMLRDKTGGGAVMLLPIGFRCVGVWISIALPVLFVLRRTFRNVNIG
jgi:hypothetical protein